MTTMFSPSEVLDVNAISLRRRVDQLAEAALEILLLLGAEIGCARARPRASGTSSVCSTASAANVPTG